MKSCCMLTRHTSLVNGRQYWLLGPVGDGDQQIIIKSCFASIYFDAASAITGVAVFLRESLSQRLILWHFSRDQYWWHYFRDYPEDWPRPYFWLNPIAEDEKYSQHFIYDFLRKELKFAAPGRLARPLRNAGYSGKVLLALEDRRVCFDHCLMGAKIKEKIKRRAEHGADLLAFNQAILQGARGASTRPHPGRTKIKGIVF